MTGIVIGTVSDADSAEWLRMRKALWPEPEPAHEVEIDRYLSGEAVEPQEVLLARLDGRPKGFAELSIRAYAEGCASGAVGYLEGLYVDPDCRRAGVARALVAAAEDWARDRGCTEFASDADLTNEVSVKVHVRLGFSEVGQIRCFRKDL